MYITTAELLSKPGKRALAGQYHDSLEPHLHRIPGFIRETRFAAIDEPNKVLILTHWTDSAAVKRWRNQSDHLRIQEKSNRDVFDSYTIRMGPAYEADRGTVESVQQPRCFMVLYWRERNERALATEKTSEFKCDAVSRVKAGMLESAMYVNGTSVLHLSTWASQEDALMYEESVVRVKGDHFEQVCVQRSYTKERRQDAPHEKPGHEHEVL